MCSAAELVPFALLGALAGIFQAFVLSAFHRRLLNQHALPLVALPGTAKAYDHRRESAILSRSPGERRITAWKINEVIEIGTSEAQRPLGLYAQETATEYFRTAFGAFGIAEDREDHQVCRR